jgi:hypothetical protein
MNKAICTADVWDSKSSRPMLMVRSTTALAFAWFATCVTAVVACNIPVFRYALERWKPDASEVVVFHNGTLSTEEFEQIKSLTAPTHQHVNANVVQVDLASAIHSEHTDLWTELKQSSRATLPHVLVRTKLGQGRFINHWHGSLASACEVGLYLSPAREEIRDRILAGHSVVWLLVASQDAEKTQAAKQLTEGTFESLSKNVPLPEGIGLPGSELYSEVPLVLKFSLLQIDPKDPKEAFLVRLLTGFRSQAFEGGEPLLVPVFGRGRALEVIPASDLNAKLIEDLTLYLSGACSCQVKEQNPGFDLLIDTDWESELFGSEANLPPDRSEEEGQSRSPKLLTIPPGRKR